MDQNDENGGNIVRHCGFCHSMLFGPSLQFCGKCCRRPYCSRECQEKDWTSKKNTKNDGNNEGQGHEDWCELLKSEENLDWCRKEDLSGGKGVVALRLIRQGEKIMVHGVDDKIYGKCSDEKAIFNHSCDANAGRYYGMDLRVLIVYAEKDIAPGSEITLNYIGFNLNFLPTFASLSDKTKVPITSFADSREVLKSRYGIVCPEDCFCFDTQVENIIIRGKAILEKTRDLDKENRNREVRERRIKESQRLLNDIDKIGGNRLAKAQLICIFLKAIEEAPKHWLLIPECEKEALDIFKSIFHPDSICSKLDFWMFGRIKRSSSDSCYELDSTFFLK